LWYLHAKTNVDEDFKESSGSLITLGTIRGDAECFMAGNITRKRKGER
jgi:hypothetical protein